MILSRPARDERASRLLLYATLLALAVSATIGGCRRRAPEPQPPVAIGRGGVTLVAYINATADCEQPTVELLHSLREEYPQRLDIEIVDIADEDGARRWRDAGFDCVAITLDGHATVTWGEGDDSRTISFMHPAGFCWTHDDLCEALEAGVRGALRAAEPEEAEGLRLTDATVEGRSIRVGDSTRETGQLLINGHTVLEIGESAGDLAPGQRVTAAADALSQVLEEPFTPNRLATTSTDEGIAVVAGETQLLTATDDDARASGVSPEVLAARWRCALRDALIRAAIKRNHHQEDGGHGEGQGGGNGEPLSSADSRG